MFGNKYKLSLEVTLAPVIKLLLLQFKDVRLYSIKCMVVVVGYWWDVWVWVKCVGVGVGEE